MKTFLLTLTADEAEAIGYALIRAIAAEKSLPLGMRNPNLIARLEEANHKLDTAPEKPQ